MTELLHLEQPHHPRLAADAPCCSGQGQIMVLLRSQHDGASAVDGDGWFTTGDVATIDPLGHMAITDRSKDVIKSGGEWISSIDIENVAVSHPKACP